MRSQENNHADVVNATAIKQEFATDQQVVASETLSSNRSNSEPTSSVVNKEQSSNVICDGPDMVHTQTAIKLEKTFDFEVFPDRKTTLNNNSISIPLDVNKTILIKEEACDRSSENISLVNEAIQSEKTKIKKENEKSLQKSQHASKQQKLDIEKVFIDEQQSADVDIKNEIVDEDDHMLEFQITVVEDRASCGDIFDETISAAPSGCTDSISSHSTSPLKLNQRASPTKSQKPEKVNNKLKRDVSPLQCDLCPSSFRHKAKLKAHMKSHTAAKEKAKILCEICGKNFSSNSALKKHLKFTHTNNRPFACEICGRAFKDSNGLKVHVRSHSGEVRTLFYCFHICRLSKM